MKQFLLFAGDDYYPSGGWRDFRGAFATHDEAVLAGERMISGEEEGSDYDWYNVADALTLKQVADGDRRA